MLYCKTKPQYEAIFGFFLNKRKINNLNKCTMENIYVYNEDLDYMIKVDVFFVSSIDVISHGSI